MASIRNYIINKIKNNRGFILLLMVFFAMRWSFADHYRVPTGSMLPTIEIGDHVFVNKMAYDLKIPFTELVINQIGEPKRGDIVVFKYPKDLSINFVKRLIGLPGDQIEILNGFIRINGETVFKLSKTMQSYLSNLKNYDDTFHYQEVISDKEFTVRRVPYVARDHYMKFKVPEGKLFFMGDNRDNSADSRFWGFVPRENLKGKVHNVTFSISFDGVIPNVKFGRFGKKLI